MCSRKTTARGALVLFILLLATSRAGAEAGWTDPGPVVAFEANIFGRILVEVDTGGNPSGCKEKTLFFREVTGTGSDQMHQLLLEATTHRIPVRLRVTGVCHLKGYSEISAVTMVPK